MSCYICSADHIAALAVAIVHRVGVHGYLSDGTSREQAVELAHMMYGENVASFRHYRWSRDDIEDSEPDWTAVIGHRTPEAQPSALALIKSIHCYQYQACEHEAWESSDVKALTDELIAYLIPEIPGYFDAEWGAPKPLGFTRPEP